jgi:hypothetical protein
MASIELATVKNQSENLQAVKPKNPVYKNCIKPVMVVGGVQ